MNRIEQFIISVAVAALVLAAGMAWALLYLRGAAT
jgi:hypothetical protein